LFNTEPYSGFYKLSRTKRLELLKKNGVISAADMDILQNSTSQVMQDVADKMIENSLGCFPLPLGLATNCIINGKMRLIPMATEETSVIAAVSSAAKWLQQHKANVITSQQGWGIIGQVHFVEKASLDKVSSYILQHKQRLLDFLNSEVAPVMHKRGGGFFDIRLHYINEDGSMLAVNVYFNPVESMGANLVTQGCEALKKLIYSEIGINGLMAIVSNSCDIKQTIAEVKINGVESLLLDKIVAASKVAESDPWRASTHNKGILNGIDAVAIATGNDWRAIEASLHSFASGAKYRPLATWSRQGDVLVGRIAGSLPVALVGGATLHPMAKICKKILGASSAQDLAGVFMAVGLIQNLAALKALVSGGLVAGHMKLHIENLMLYSGVDSTEEPILREQLNEHLCLTGRVTFSDAMGLLRTIRHQCGAKIKS
jgi:hydroxymethylglutaryl-CoA reductase